jgi:hypothetical protein
MSGGFLRGRGPPYPRLWRRSSKLGTGPPRGTRPAGARCTVPPASGIALTPVPGAFTGYGATPSLSVGVDVARLG